MIKLGSSISYFHSDVIHYHIYSPVKVNISTILITKVIVIMIEKCISQDYYRGLFICQNSVLLILSWTSCKVCCIIDKSSSFRSLTGIFASLW